MRRWLRFSCRNVFFSPTGDVLSAWSGIRPLVSDPNKGDTQSIARNHIVHVSDSNLVTLAGGKWTTFRSMAADCIDAAIKACNLHPEYKKSQSMCVSLEGSENWTPTMYIRLVQDFGLESEVAKHMANAYGDRAFAVAKLASVTGKRYPIIGKRIHPEFPYIDAEIRYGVREYACTAIDMIARRIRLAFLNVEAAQEALPDIINIMGEELGWDEKEKEVGRWLLIVGFGDVHGWFFRCRNKRRSVRSSCTTRWDRRPIGSRRIIYRLI